MNLSGLPASGSRRGSEILLFGKRSPKLAQNFGLKFSVRPTALTLSNRTKVIKKQSIPMYRPSLIHGVLGPSADRSLRITGRIRLLSSKWFNKS